MATVPAGVVARCPRCWALRSFSNVSGGGITYRCGGCEWTFTFGTQAPTGTTNAVLTAGGGTISVASGGASFTNGMILLLDTGTNAEVVTVNGSATGTSIPVAGGQTGQTRGGLLRGHSSGVTFGQLLVSSTYGGTGEEAVPQNAY